MTVHGGMTAGWRRLGLALIVLGLALRIAIAPGMMPVPTPQGMILTLCTAQGPVEYKLDIHGKQPVGEVHDPCPYGAMAAVPLVPLLTAAASTLMVGMAAPSLPNPAVERPHIGVPAPPPPATGPPLLV